MRIASLLLIISILAVGVSTATVLTPSNPCVGACPGAGPIQIFSGNPGIFLDSAVMQISIQHITPLDLSLQGELISAMFRDPSGQLGFYYQVSVDQTSLAYLRDIFFINLITSTTNYPFLPDVGVRVDGIGTFGAVTFLPSTEQPTTITLLPDDPWAHMAFDFVNLLPPGQVSSTFVVLSNDSYMKWLLPNGSPFSQGLAVGGLDPNHPDQTFSVCCIGTGSILVPTAPEPATWMLLGLGLITLVVLHAARRARLLRS